MKRFLTLCLFAALLSFAGQGAARPAALAAAATVDSMVHSVSLTWSASSTPSVSYSVYRATASGAYSTPLATGISALAYTDAAVNVGTTYFYTVTAVDSSGESAKSNEVVAAVQINPPVVTATVTATKKVLLAFRVAGASSYNVYRSQASAGPFVLLAHGILGVSYTDATVVSGQSYYYVVTTIVPGGKESAYSNVVTYGGIATPPASSATFVKTDLATSGSWTGVYGAGGYVIAPSTSKPPSYGTAASTGTPYVWAASTSDPRALFAPGSTSRIASCWYGASFTIDVNLTDGNIHQIALYALDWDSNARAETIQITDVTSGALLSSEKIASFNKGAYLIWNVSGHVKITVTSTAGANAVVSALM